MKTEPLRLPPEDYRLMPVEGPGLSNGFGGAAEAPGVDEGVEELLRQEKVIVHHSAFDFHGYVWFQDGQFHEVVMRNHEPVANHSADMLEELFKEVNEQWGWL